MQKYDDRTPDEKLANLLSSLKTEPVFSDDFEEKFLQEMHRRRAQEPMRKPVSTSVGALLSNLFRAKWVYGAATAVTAIAILAIVMFDSKPMSNTPGFVSSDNISNLQPVSLVNEEDTSEGDENQQADSKLKEDVPEADLETEDGK